MGGLVDARATAHHLVEQDGRRQVAEEHHRVQALDVHAGGQQVDGAGDEAALCRPTQRRQQLGTTLVGALEGVVVLGCAALAAAPGRIVVLQALSHTVGMGVAVAEHDHLLLRPAVGTQALEQVVAHGVDAQRHHQVTVEALGHVARLQIVGPQVAAGAGVQHALGQHLLAGVAAAIDRRLQLHDFAGRQVAVFLRLDQRVLVHRLAEVGQVAGGDAGVVGIAAAGIAQLARRGGQADVDGCRVAAQHLGPAAPGRAVAFIDDDHRKGVVGIVPAEEAGRASVLIVQPQRLVGGDVHLGIAGGVVAVLGLHHPHAATGEGAADLVQCLAAQLVAVAQEQRRLGQAARLVQPPQQIGRDDGLARAGGQAQQHPRLAASLLTLQQLAERGADGGILVVARAAVGRAVGLEQQLCCR